MMSRAYRPRPKVDLAKVRPPSSPTAAVRPAKAKPAAPKPAERSFTDPEIVLRVKRRVGPSMYSVVGLVLDALQDVWNSDLSKPDPWEIKE